MKTLFQIVFYLHLANLSLAMDLPQWIDGKCFYQGKPGRQSGAFTICGSFENKRVSGGTLSSVDLTGISLFSSILLEENWKKVLLDSAILQEMLWYQSKMESVSIKKANLRGITIKKSIRKNCDFQSSQLQAVKFFYSQFYNSDFRNTNFSGSIIQQSTFNNCDFRNADLREALWIQNKCNNCKADGFTLLPFSQKTAIEKGFLFE